jgi:hypothetical protein
MDITNKDISHNTVNTSNAETSTIENGIRFRNLYETVKHILLHNEKIKIYTHNESFYVTFDDITFDTNALLP